jgi:quercetin dioxygenase-like cupin family protein
MIRTLVAGATVVAGLAALGFQYTHAEPAAPKGNKGFTTSKTQVIDLGPEIDGMKGRQLRLRVLHIEPGGQIGAHDHKNRPAVVYVISGEASVFGPGGKKKTYRPGDTSSATKDTTHWYINEGKEPFVFVAVDVFQPETK